MMLTISFDLAVDKPPVSGIPGCYMVDASPIVFGSFATLLCFEIGGYRLAAVYLVNGLINRFKCLW